MADWTDQVAIVTGSSRGIGRAIARALSMRGAAICINYATRTAEAEAAAAEIAATGRRVIANQANVADADAVTRMVARTEAELGRSASSSTIPAFRRRRRWRAMTRGNGAYAARQYGWGDPHNPGRGAADAEAGLRPASSTSPPIRRSARHYPARRSMRRPKRRCLILTRRLAMELGLNAVAPGVDRDGDGTNRTPESGFVTAQVITVDGGRMDYMGHA